MKAADVANISDALAQPTAASNGVRESLITKDSHTELKLYLNEPLLLIDE